MYYNMERSGNIIRQLRKQNGYTQEELAKALSIDRSFYSRIESGKSGCSVDLLVQLSDMFEVSLDYLILGKHPGVLTKSTESALLKGEMEKLMAHLEEFMANF